MCTHQKGQTYDLKLNTWQHENYSAGGTLKRRHVESSVFANTSVSSHQGMLYVCKADLWNSLKGNNKTKQNARRLAERQGKPGFSAPSNLIISLHVYREEVKGFWFEFRVIIQFEWSPKLQFWTEKSVFEVIVSVVSTRVLEFDRSLPIVFRQHLPWLFEVICHSWLVLQFSSKFAGF